MKSLITLAATNSLPYFQYIDQATCAWIRQNNPKLAVTLPLEKGFFAQYMANLSIPSHWLLEARLKDSLHGFRHLYRSGYYALYLAQELMLEKKQISIVIIAALLHDVRRLHDKGDEGHASRTAQWFRTNLKEIEAEWQLSLNTKEVDAIETAISLHETPYDKLTLPQLTQYKKHKDIVDIVKTADALDRYRLPKLKWWITDKYLKLVPSPGLKQLAYELVLGSEQEFLNSNDSTTSILTIIERLSRQTEIWTEAHLLYKSSLADSESRI